ncbi:type I secretion system permease/ATPase [Legionella spiritensis]|uniref:Toxin secretion ATP binding protein n=1 Tax=Legionella spiritensis TaxID=452 RepID=A0A0W0Z4P8_LEGSP|nr:type I secretion system permease/ATPase [Legionella spiritensis]KTD64081.1 toxin secretion ATP binding protein [Legionella spiritensis]SNV37648.1 toxin secretion ATP binding protein [Legionella spiritensis]
MSKKKLTVLEEAFQSCKKAFIYIGLFSLFINILMLTIPIYMMQIFDRVLASHSYDTLIYLTLIALLALLILSILDAVRTYIIIQVSVWLDRKLTPAALALCPDQQLMGNIYPEQVLRDISMVRQFLGSPALFTLFDAPWVPVYLIVIFLLDPILGLISTIGAVILFACALVNELATRKLLEETNNISLSNNLETTATFRNAEVIQAMGMLYPLVQNWYKNNEKVLEFQSKSSKISGNILSVSKFLRSTLQVLILGFGAYLVIINQITPGMMIAASILMARALSPVEQAISSWKQYQGAKQAKERLRPHFSFFSGRFAGMTLPDPKGTLSLENIFYSPPNMNRYVINNINYQINPGEMVALIGPSAAGKSTLARLIVGVIKPGVGSIRLDSADVFQWDRVDFGRHVGYLPQDIELFNGTIKENIARMGVVDERAVIKAAQLAGCHELILRLPMAYDTLVSRSGFSLSGGQRQRIALARALYRDPQLIVLDEPNSNLDMEGEQALIAALSALKKRSATVVVVAHRPNILKHVDTIIVLNEGKIQFSGPRDQILSKLRELSRVSPQQARPGEGLHNG